jgi:hypothetical protein
MLSFQSLVGFGLHTVQSAGEGALPVFGVGQTTLPIPEKCAEHIQAQTARASASLLANFSI